MCEVFAYVDEAGALSARNQDFFYGGVMFFSRKECDRTSRRYNAAESEYRREFSVSRRTRELKGRRGPQLRHRLLSVLEGSFPFGIVLRREHAPESLYRSGRHACQYLDHLLVMAIDEALRAASMFRRCSIDDVSRLSLTLDQYPRAKGCEDGLKRKLEMHLSEGFYGPEPTRYNEPVLPNLDDLDVTYADSRTCTLVRAAGVVVTELRMTSEKKENIGEFFPFMPVLEV